MRFRRNLQAAIFPIDLVHRNPDRNACFWMGLQKEVVLMHRLTTGSWGLEVEHRLRAVYRADHGFDSVEDAAVQHVFASKLADLQLGTAVRVDEPAGSERGRRR